MFSPLQVEIRPSRMLLGCLLALHAAALLAIWFSGFDVFSKFVFSLLSLLMWCYWAPRYLLLRHSLSITGLRWLADRKSLAVCLGGEQWLSVVSTKQTMVWPFLIALSVEVKGRYHPLTVFVPFDSLEPQQFRRLKVVARYAVPVGGTLTSTRS